MSKGFQELNARLDSRTDGVENRLDARITEFEERLGTQITVFEERLGARITDVDNRLDARMTVLENRLDAGMAELRAAYARTNRRIDQLFYTLVGIGGALLVGMAAILIRSFL